MSRDGGSVFRGTLLAVALVFIGGAVSAAPERIPVSAPANPLYLRGRGANGGGLSFDWIWHIMMAEYPKTSSKLSFSRL